MAATHISPQHSLLPTKTQPFLHSHTHYSLPSSSSSFLQIPRNSHNSKRAKTNLTIKMRAVPSMKEIPPNALRRKKDPHWFGGFSLGIDLGLSRTGLAISKGFQFRPLTVLNLRGEQLELKIMDIAKKEEVEEFVIGLPRSIDGNETPQSNKVRSVAGRLAIRAAERGVRVFLLDEHGTSAVAMHRMIDLGLSKSARGEKIDAYAAVMLLEKYFSMFGKGTELVWPKQLVLQEKIRKGPEMDDDDDSDDDW